MADAVSQNEKLNTVIQCSSCSKVFTDPRTLPCLHSFCSECISQWCKEKRPVEKVACPECRKEFAIPENGVGGLKKNLFIENLLSIHNENQKTEEFCEICRTEEKRISEMFCLQCEQIMCKSCGSAHLRMKISNSHQLMSLKELKCGVESQKKPQPILCDKHKNKQIKLYCFEHKAVICLKCKATTCKSHKCEDVMKVAGEFRVDIEKNKKHARKVLGEVDQKVGVLRFRKWTFFEQVKNAKTMIFEKAEQMVRMIENHQKQMISELKEIEDKYEREMDSCISEITKVKSSLTAFTNQCDNLLKRGTDVDISRVADSLRTRFEELADKKNVEEAFISLNETNVIFTSSSLNFDNPKSILGTVTTEVRPNIAHTVLTGEGLVFSLALMNDELFVTRLRVSHVSVFDTKTLQLKRNLSVPKLGPLPCGLAACPFNKLLFVSDLENDCVHKVDLTSCKNITCWKTASKPIELSLTVKHNLLVTSTCLPACKVQEYTPTGSLVRELVCYGNNLHQAVETPGGTLLIVRSGPTHGIAELTWKGTILRYYGDEQGSGQGQMYLPRSLAVTSNGIVLVVEEGNNRIQVLDSSLTTARTLQLPDSFKPTLNSPIAVCYDESRGRLFVGECYGECRVLAFDKVVFQ